LGRNHITRLVNSLLITIKQKLHIKDILGIKSNIPTCGYDNKKISIFDRIKKIFGYIDFPGTYIKKLEGMHNSATIDILETIRLFIYLSLFAAVMHFSLVMQFSFCSDKSDYSSAHEIFNYISKFKMDQKGNNQRYCEIRFQASLVAGDTRFKSKFIQFLVGKGWVLKKTNFFYSSFKNNDNRLNTKWVLFWLVLLFYTFSLLVYMYDLKTDFSRLLSTMKSDRYNITNIIFSTWNFNAGRKNFIEKIQGYQSQLLDMFLVDYELKKERVLWKRSTRIKRIVKTVFLEFAIFFTIFISLIVIWVLSKLEVKLEMFEDSDKFNKEHSINFLSFYAPTIALYIVEMFVPSFFGYLNQKQMYLQRTKLKLQILRKTILDIFSTYTYIVAVLQIKKCDSVDVCNVGRIGCMRLLCWEKYACSGCL